MPGAAPARGVGPEEGAFSFPPRCVPFRPRGTGWCPPTWERPPTFLRPQFSANLPGKHYPPASPEVTAHLAGHAGEHGPRFTEGQRRFPSAGPRPACECPPPTPLHPLFTDLMPCCVLVPHGPLSLGKEPTLQPEEHGEGRCPGLPEGHPGHAPQGEDPMGRQPSPGIV